MEDEHFSKLCNIWNVIGPFNMDLFGDRLVLQKKVFLLKEIGFDLGYNFNFYKRGPYCSELATDGYKIKVKGEIEGADRSSNEAINILKELSDGHEADVYWFEMLATLVYLFKNYKYSDKENLRKKLLEYKPHLDDLDMFNEAYSVLKMKKLIF